MDQMLGQDWFLQHKCTNQAKSNYASTAFHTPAGNVNDWAVLRALWPLRSADRRVLLACSLFLMSRKCLK